MYRPYSSSLADSRPFLDVQSLLRNLAQDFVTAFNTGNYDQAAALFTTDGAFMAPHHEPAYGPKAVEHLLRQFGDAGYEDLRLETVRVESSGDMAMDDRSLLGCYPAKRWDDFCGPRQVCKGVAPSRSMADCRRLLEQ